MTVIYIKEQIEKRLGIIAFNTSDVDVGKRLSDVLILTALTILIKSQNRRKSRDIFLSNNQ